MSYSTILYLGDKLKCYLPPPATEKRKKLKDFETMLRTDCDKLFSPDDSPEYRQSQVTQILNIGDRQVFC